LGAQIDETSLGLLVSSVLEGTLAERLGLKKGDIVGQVNDKPAATLEALEEEIVTALRAGTDITVLITRAGEDLSFHHSVGRATSRSVAIPSLPKTGPNAPKTVESVDVDQVVTAKTDCPDALGIIMGIEDYRYAPAVPFARHDALVAYEYFVKTLGIRESNIYLRTDRDATQGEFRKAFDPEQGWLAKRIKPNKTDVFVYFIGHGAPDVATQDAFLIPADGDPNYPATGFWLDELYNSLNRLPARQTTVLIDACFSGQTGRGEKIEMLLAGSRGISVQARRTSLAPHVAVLTAAQGNQVSSAYPEKSHGLFTYFVLKGIQGEADQDADRMVTLGQLYAYVRAGVESQAGRLDREQIPELMGVDPGRMLVEY
ncbi:MAG: caspase family protein, partial [candidate division Zixibacteria bacterium]|nr:caspase family protein [candidate division Zixibacteria bacterium]